MLHIHQEDWSGKGIQERIKEQTLSYEPHVQPLWKTHSALSLHKLEEIYQKLVLNEDLEIECLDIDLLQSSFNGQTIFSLFDHDIDMLKRI